MFKKWFVSCAVLVLGCGVLTVRAVETKIDAAQYRKAAEKSRAEATTSFHVMISDVNSDTKNDGSSHSYDINVFGPIWLIICAIPVFLMWLANKRKCKFCGKLTSRANVVCRHCGKTDSHMEGDIFGRKRTCPYCKQKTSSESRLCVHCGRDVYQHWNYRIGNDIVRYGCLGVLVLIVILIVLYSR